LEDSTNTTAANELLRNKREQEVFELKKSIDEEVRSHETAIQELRRKHTQQLEEATEQLDQVRKVNRINALVIDRWMFQLSFVSGFSKPFIALLTYATLLETFNV